VVACNTATAAAIDVLRVAWPQLPIVGVEPALGPAARNSRTHCVGVLATHGTLESQRFQRLLASHSADTRFALQACDGLAQAIEARIAAPYPATTEEAALWQLSAHYIEEVLGTFGTPAGAMDSLVLGCTHYALLEEGGMWNYLTGPNVRTWSSGAAVARQTRRVLGQAGWLAQEAPHRQDQPLLLYTTGAWAALQAAAGFGLGVYAWDYHCEEAFFI